MRWKAWIRRVLRARAEKALDGTEAFALAKIAPKIRAALRQRGIALRSPALWITAGRIPHITREAKQRRGRVLSEADRDGLASALARPRAVLLDKESDSLIFLFDAADAGVSASGRRRCGKVAVALNYPAEIKTRPGGKRKAKVINSVRTAEYIDASGLPASRYELLGGER